MESRKGIWGYEAWISQTGCQNTNKLEFEWNIIGAFSIIYDKNWNTTPGKPDTWIFLDHCGVWWHMTIWNSITTTWHDIMTLLLTFYWHNKISVVMDLHIYSIYRLFDVLFHFCHFTILWLTCGFKHIWIYTCKYIHVSCERLVVLKPNKLSL
jgi:hypothetical protein